MLSLRRIERLERMIKERFSDRPDFQTMFHRAVARVEALHRLPLEEQLIRAREREAAEAASPLEFHQFDEWVRKKLMRVPTYTVRKIELEILKRDGRIDPVTLAAHQEALGRYLMFGEKLLALPNSGKSLPRKRPT